MKIEDLLQMDPILGFRKPLNRDSAVFWSLDQIERVVHHPALHADENELLALVARRIRDERDYRISDDVPPPLSSAAIWSPIPDDKEIGHEEALFRRADHRLPA